MQTSEKIVLEYEHPSCCMGECIDCNQFTNKIYVDQHDNDEDDDTECDDKLDVH